MISCVKGKHKHGYLVSHTVYTSPASSGTRLYMKNSNAWNCRWYSNISFGAARRSYLIYTYSSCTSCMHNTSFIRIMKIEANVRSCWDLDNQNNIGPCEKQWRNVTRSIPSFLLICLIVSHFSFNFSLIKDHTHSWLLIYLWNEWSPPSKILALFLMNSLSFVSSLSKMWRQIYAIKYQPLLKLTYWRLMKIITIPTFQFLVKRKFPTKGTKLWI